MAKSDIFEVRAVGHRTRLHEDVYHRVLTTSWPVFFLLIVGAFITANAIFATLYLLQPGSIAGARPGSFPDAFFFSVQTMGTIGYGVFAPATAYAQVIVTFEAVTGLIGVALATGVTFAKFARPTARIVFSARAVIGQRNGKPCLMFRMANARMNTIVEASLKVLVLLDVVTSEGERMRVPTPLKLVRDENPFFRLSWTAIHEIDEKSPFHGEGALERLRERNSIIMLVLSGLDETIAQTVHARQAYTPDEVVAGARFADIISVEADGTRVIDYTKFHDVLMEADGSVVHFSEDGERSAT